MFTTVRQFEMAGGSMQETMKLIQDDFVPDLMKVPGFVAYDAIDAGTKLVTITTFESEEGVRDSDRRSAKFVADHPELARHIASRQAVLGEVRIHRLTERKVGSYTR